LCRWNLFNFATEVWGGINYIFTGDELPQAGNGIMIGNHAAGLDFTTGITISGRMTSLGPGRTMVLMKNSLKYVPTVGFMQFLQGSLFLRRNWEKDQLSINKKLENIARGFWPQPFLIGIYPEGTRITAKKRADSHEFAKQRELPILNHVLLPRTKGFTHLMQKLHTNLDYIIDAVLAYSSPIIAFHPFIYGQFLTKSVHVNITNYAAKDIPAQEKEQSEWLLQRFVEKDKKLEYFAVHKQFPAPITSATTNKSSSEVSKAARIDTIRRNRLRFTFLLWSLGVNVVLAGISQQSSYKFACLGGFAAWTVAHTYFNSWK
jgi:lysocardiolipin and lysophospholipid acyltransferase